MDGGIRLTCKLLGSWNTTREKSGEKGEMMIIWMKIKRFSRPSLKKKNDHLGVFFSSTTFRCVRRSRAFVFPVHLIWHWYRSRRERDYHTFTSQHYGLPPPSLSLGKDIYRNKYLCVVWISKSWLQMSVCFMKFWIKRHHLYYFNDRDIFQQKRTVLCIFFIATNVWIISTMTQITNIVFANWWV